ncbi:hypothetical protein GJ496_002167 [Pomphorhynchus laevis]|nr:hypothetical protein GJ496_002167 [Pomphorhynchus laevis]
MNFEHGIDDWDLASVGNPTINHGLNKPTEKERSLKNTLLNKFSQFRLDNLHLKSKSAVIKSNGSSESQRHNNNQYDNNNGFTKLVKKDVAECHIVDVGISKKYPIKPDVNNNAYDPFDVVNLKNMISSNDIDYKLNDDDDHNSDEIVDIYVAKELIVDMYAVIQDLLLTVEQNKNISAEQASMFAFENKQLKADLDKSFTSYDDIRERYEKLRTALSNMIKIAEEYEVRLNEQSKILENEQHRYEKLKTTMENKLISVVNERNDMKLGFEKKLHAMKTSAQKASITIDYLNNSLNLKNDQLLKLNKFCDAKLNTL